VRRELDALVPHGLHRVAADGRMVATNTAADAVALTGWFRQ
jgi:hypothetical protein